MNRSQAYSCYFQHKLPPLAPELPPFLGFPSWCNGMIILLLTQAHTFGSRFSISAPSPCTFNQLPNPFDPISKTPPVSAPSFKSQCFNSGLVTSCLEHCKILLTTLTHSIIHKPHCHWSVSFGACHQSLWCFPFT